jgi:hypothetical protein
MAVLFDFQNAQIEPGFTIDAQPLTVPAGTVAITYAVSVGNLNNPQDEDFSAWVEARESTGTWREISRFRATGSSESTGRIPVRGRPLRLSAACSIRTRLTLLAETSA